MLHLGTLGKGPTDLATLELLGPDEDGRLGISIGPHKGQRYVIWFNRGAMSDVRSELEHRLSLMPHGISQRDPRRTIEVKNP